VGDSIKEGPTGQPQYAAQSIAANLQFGPLGSGGAYVFDMGLKQETTAQIVGQFSPASTVSPTATFATGTNTVVVSSMTGVSTGMSIMGVGFLPNTVITGTSTSGGTLTLSQNTTGTGTTSPVIICTAPTNVYYGEAYPGSVAQGYYGLSNSIQQLSYNNSGVPTDILIMAGKNDGYEQTVSPTISTTSGSNTATLSSVTSVNVGTMISTANLAAGTTILTISSNTITLSNNASATASGTACQVSTATPLTIVTTNGSGTVTVSSGSYTQIATEDVITATPFSTTNPPYVVSGGGTSTLTLSAPAANTGTYSAMVHYPLTAYSTYTGSLTSFVSQAHSAGDTKANGGGVTFETIIDSGNGGPYGFAQGSYVAKGFLTCMNAYLKSGAAGNDYLIDAESFMPSNADLLSANTSGTLNPLMYSDYLHTSVQGSVVYAQRTAIAVIANEPSLFSGTGYGQPGLGMFNGGSKTIYVGSLGDDNKPISLKYSPLYPYATVAAAMAVANSPTTYTSLYIPGDQIVVLDGPQTISALNLKNGVNITFMPPATITSSPSGVIFQDNGTSVSCTITGFGQTINDTAAFSSVLTLTGSNSSVSFQGLNAYCSTGAIALLLGGNHENVYWGGNITTGATTSAIQTAPNSTSTNTVTVTGNLVGGSEYGLIYGNGLNSVCTIGGNVTYTGSAGTFGWAFYGGSATTDTLTVGGTINGGAGGAVYAPEWTVTAGNIVEGTNAASHYDYGGSYLGLINPLTAPVTVVKNLANPSTTAFTYTFTGVGNQLINLTQTGGTMATGTFNLPGDTYSINNQTLEIANDSTNAITSFVVSPASGTVYGAPTTIPAGGRVTIKKVSSNVWSAK
jgi:hypothetical protein